MNHARGPTNILLVEDSNVDAILFQSHLKKAAAAFFVHRTDHLASGLEYLQNADVHVILLDLNLPDSMGLETFSAIHRRVPHIPIVVLSGQDDAELALEAVAEGAQDYLPKSEANSSTLTRSIRYAVERSHHQKVEREVLAASEIQRRLFPQCSPVQRGVDIYGRCDPANLAGGDYFDFFELQDGNQAMVIADVSGHGLGPAMIMAETRAILRSLATTCSDVGEILTRTNHVLAADLEDDVFVALLLISLNWDNLTMRFASAGHPGLIMDSTGEVGQRFKSNDPPLGVVEEHCFDTSSDVGLKRHETIVLYTDGIVEAMNSKQEQYSEERMLDSFRACRQQSSQATIDYLFEQVQAYSNHTAQQDDMTAVLAKIS